MLGMQAYLTFRVFPLKIFSQYVFLRESAVYNVEEFSANIGGGGFVVWMVIPDNITGSLLLGCDIRS